MKCFGYVRVSTEKQAGEKVTSVGDQRAAIELLAAKLGVTVDEWFTDAGASGATAERRKDFMRLVGACQALPRSRRDPGFILALNDSRFGRFSDVGEATHWRVTFRKLGWVVRFCESDDMADGMGREFVRLASSAQASEYLRNLKANATRGSRGAAAQGFWVSSAPFGYRRAVVYPESRVRILENGVPKAKDEKVKLALYEAEAAIVRECFHRYQQPDATLASLAEWIAGVAPSRKWSVPAVRHVLGNPAYLGNVVIGRRMADEDDPGHVVMRTSGERWGMDNAHPSIVTADQFAAVARKLKQNADAPRRARSEYALSGLLRCLCGEPYLGGGTKGPKLNAYYRSMTCRCAGSVARHLIEPAVIGALAQLLSSPSMQRRIRKATERTLDAYANPAPDRTLVAQERKARQRQDNLVAAIALGTLTPTEAQTAMDEVRGELARIEAAKSDARFLVARQASMETEREQIIRQVLDAPARLSGARPSAIREQVALWCQSLTYNRTTRSVRMEVRTGIAVIPSNLAAAACPNLPSVVQDVPLPKRKVAGAQSFQVPADLGWGGDVKPFNLYREGLTEAVAQACGSCGRVYLLNDAYAMRCCEVAKCEDCGELAAKGWTVCQPCRGKRDAKREAERVEKATVVNEADYSGPVYHDRLDSGEGFASDTDHFRDSWECCNEDEPLPEYVWACTAVRLAIPTVDTLIENATQDSFDGAYDAMSEGDVDALQTAIHAFNESHSATEWNIDYRRRMLLAKSEILVPLSSSHTPDGISE